MIGSRKLSIGCAISAGISSIPFSLVLGRIVWLGGHQDAGFLWWLPLLGLFLPPVAFTGLVVLLSRRQHRPVALAAGILVSALAFTVIFLWSTVENAVFAQELEFVNTTRQPVVVYVAQEGRELSFQASLVPTQQAPEPSRKQAFRRYGSSIRIAAYFLDQEQLRKGNLLLAQSPADDRKVYDRVLTWTELQNMGNRLAISSGNGPQ